MAGPSVLHGLGVRFMPGMSASIHVVFCHIFLIILYSMLSNGIRMVAHASWRSKALRVVPAQASDLHNAWVTIINPFTKNQKKEAPQQIATKETKNKKHVQRLQAPVHNNDKAIACNTM